MASATITLVPTHNTQEEPEEEEDTELEQTLQTLFTFLSFLGFRHSSKLSFALSWTGFCLVGVFLPVFVLVLSDCEGCERYQLTSFELEIVGSQICVAAVSLACVGYNLSKYGIRKFLFVDRYSGQMSRFHDHYIRQIRVSIRLLVIWSVSCFVLKLVREIIRISYVRHESWWISVAILLALTVSWTYLSAISLSASIMFHLICSLQAVHFDDYAKLLESESDVLVLMEEHIRLRYHLSKISHRCRIYLILAFLVVTITQFVSLFQITGYSEFTLTNGGDFAVSALVQLVGITICLHAATRISHRAQRIASLASRWHASITCASYDSTLSRHSNSYGNLEAANRMNRLNTIHLDYSESDSDSLDLGWMPTNIQLVSYMSCYQKRHSFVMYLQRNSGGITLYGCTADRGLINAIFFMQLTLVTFVLGKTLVLSSTSSGAVGASHLLENFVHAGNHTTI